MRSACISITKIAGLAFEGHLWCSCRATGYVAHQKKLNAAEGINITQSAERHRMYVYICTYARSPSPSFSAAPGHGLLHDTVSPHPQNGEEVRRLTRQPGVRLRGDPPPNGTKLTRTPLLPRPITVQPLLSLPCPLPAWHSV